MMKRATVIVLLLSSLAVGGAAYRHVQDPTGAPTEDASCWSVHRDACCSALQLVAADELSAPARGALTAYALEAATPQEGNPAPAASQDGEKGKSGAAGGSVKKEYPEQDPALGSIEGKVTFEGTPPELPPIEIKADHPDRAKCVDFVKNERLVLSKDREICGVVLSVADYKPAQKPKPRKPTLDNKHCAFVPHVQATTIGSELEVTNSDNFLHNTRGVLALSFNTAIAGGGKETQKIRKAGRGVVSCDFHTWMQANVWVFAHDLFDWTLEDGNYKIANIPPGEYELEVWHEMLAPRGEKHKIKIEAGKATKLDWTLKAPK